QFPDEKQFQSLPVPEYMGYPKEIKHWEENCTVNTENSNFLLKFKKKTKVSKLNPTFLHPTVLQYRVHYGCCPFRCYQPNIEMEARTLLDIHLFHHKGLLHTMQQLQSEKKLKFTFWLGEV